MYKNTLSSRNSLQNSSDGPLAAIPPRPKGRGLPPKNVEKAIRGDVYDDWTNENGDRVISAYMSNKWHNSSEIGFRFLAEAGCGIQATIRGGQDQWAYDVETNSGVFATTWLTSVPEADVAIAAAAKTLIGALSHLDAAGLTEHSAVNQALEGLVASAQ